MALTLAKGAGAVSPSAQVKKGKWVLHAKAKKMHKKGHLPSVALAVNSSPMVKNLAKSRDQVWTTIFEQIRHNHQIRAKAFVEASDGRHCVDTSMLASLSRIEHQVKSSRKQQKVSMQAHAEAHLLMQQATARRTSAMTTFADENETPPPSIQNPDQLRHSSKVSSIRKRLLDQKDKDIATLNAKNSALTLKIESLDAVKKELEKEKKKTKTLQADLDRTRAEVIGQARLAKKRL